MDKAVILLKGTTLSIEEIAAMLGYSNHSNFYKAFKEYYGKTPREYIIC
jgi:YesN/AraC family two-component response regulator